jgi:hypothetical protein
MVRKVLSVLAGFATAIALTMALLGLLWLFAHWAGAHEVTGFWLLFTLAAFFVAGLGGGRIALWIHSGGVLPLVALCALWGVLRLLTGKGLDLLGLVIFLLMAGGVFVGGRRRKLPPA